METASFTYTEVPLDVRPEHPVRRNRLVSMLLQDRGVVRLISAPSGFGKTSLACEYALRLFSDKSILWVDASAPDFLCMLDAGHVPGVDLGVENHPDLLVIDGLPWLDEERSSVLAHEIDAALYKGVEVVVTTLPSTDCLRSLQPDRILIGASDLLVTEQECHDAQDASSREDKSKAAQMWKNARERFMGRIASVVWGSDYEKKTASCLSSFFDERLPLAFFRTALGILLLGHGRAEDLERVGIGLQAADARQLSNDYPFLGLDGTSSFKEPCVNLAVLHEVLCERGIVLQPMQGAVSLAQRVLSVLFERGELVRFEEVLGVFCSDEHCVSWLVEQGWDLLDMGQVELVETLFDRCPGHVFDCNLSLQALRSWANGLLGDRTEATHYARLVLSAKRPVDDEGQDMAARLAAYLALVAFGDGSVAGCGKENLDVPRCIVDARDFLCHVADSCLESELAYALCVDEPDRIAVFEKTRKPAAKRRVANLSRLFTEHHDRLKDSLGYRLSLHILQALDSVETRRLVQELGCDIVVSLRRNGLHRYSEALLVRDLWMDGYFGLSGPVGSRRDATLLEDAGAKLQELSRQRGLETTFVPWEEAERIPRGNFTGRVMKSVSGTRLRDNVEVMYVNMFGCFEIAIGERFIREGDLRKKSRILFILLALAQGRDVSRDALLEQLWPDFPRSRALDNFYTVWSGVAAEVGEGPWLERTGSFCRVNPRYVVSDVEEFERLSRQLLVGNLGSEDLLDVYAHIEQLYRGDLVPSEKGIRSIDAQRARLRAMYVDSMVNASSCALEKHDVRLSLWFARKAMEADGKREDVYFSLIRAQVAAGQRCSAIRTYFECQGFLRDEMGLDPSSETKEMYDRLITIDPGLLRLEPATFDLV